jgi:hypothetical protein
MLNNVDSNFRNYVTHLLNRVFCRRTSLSCSEQMHSGREPGWHRTSCRGAWCLRLCQCVCLFVCVCGSVSASVATPAPVSILRMPNLQVTHLIDNLDRKYSTYSLIDMTATELLFVASAMRAAGAVRSADRVNSCFSHIIFRSCSRLSPSPPPALTSRRLVLHCGQLATLALRAAPVINFDRIVVSRGAYGISEVAHSVFFSPCYLLLPPR